ncbi:hypothetical protein [Pukyongiella litopenaei]|uniref:Uncharacterized protein n=1 Tax=Pukyongiella litopenaei TaxID=2605946 RepID=A0A2S0MLW3_9RHOB|nr:hypothetical protein [Pukyongiella litopenaei]AVO36673.1 hypothetical protein C6Y53_02500 [Pukyongiella litopenaei]
MSEDAKPLWARAGWVIAAAFLAGLGGWIFTQTRDRVQASFEGAPLVLHVEHDTGEPMNPGLVTSALVTGTEHRPEDITAAETENFGWRNRSRDWSDIATRTHAIRVEFRTSLAEPVVIRRIEPRILKRADPLAGWFIADGGCGGMALRTAFVDFDAEAPKAMLSGFDDPDTEVFYVSRNEVEIVEFHAMTTSHYVEWVYDIHYTTPAGPQVTTIDNDGAPFRMSGEASSKAYTFDYSTGSIIRYPDWDGGIVMC